MINFSKISNESFLGMILRSVLKFIPKNATRRIIQGRLKGKKWIKGSGVNGYWLGSYERAQSEIFEKTLKKGDTVFDIGANVGFYSLLAAEIIGPTGKVFSFEPLPENFQYLKKHIEINNYKNIFSFEIAVSAANGFSFFEGVSNRSVGKLMKNGDIKVKTITLDDWINNRRLTTPNVLKIDVEGAEYDVLRGAENLLKNNHPVIFLSIHGEESRKNCCDYLLALEYKLKPIGTLDLAQADEILAQP